MSYINTSIENIINIKETVFFFHINSYVSFVDKGETHDFWEMVYVKKGKAIEYSNNTPYTITEGDILFHQPGEHHRTVFPDNNIYTELFFITFVCTSKAMEFFRRYHSHLSNLSKEYIENCLREASQYYMYTIINKKTTLVKSPNALIGGSQMYRISLESLLINLLREGEECSNDIFIPKDNLYEAIVENINNYLIEHLYDDISLDDICNEIKYSRTFICTHYKRLTGTTIIKHLQRLRIEEACNLILNKGYKLTKIAEMLKFSDLYYFSNTFKNYMGVAPSEYKKTKIAPIKYSINSDTSV